MAECEHRFGRVRVFTRPWWRFFRKTYWYRCWDCDLRERASDLSG